jgi:tetratricopeptide (TPR) repeat protein
LKLDPSFADAEFNWGVALRKAHRLPEAIQHLQRAVDLNQDSASHYNNLGQVLMETGQLDAAIKNLKIARQLDPDDVNACAALAVAFEHTGHTDDAIATAQTGIELARSQHQMATADQLERWIAALRARRLPSDTDGAR